MTIMEPGGGLDTWRLTEGDLYFIPRAYPHHIEVVGPSDFHFLIFFDQAMPGDIGFRASASAYSREVLAATFNTHRRRLPAFPFTNSRPADRPPLQPRRRVRDRRTVVPNLFPLQLSSIAGGRFARRVRPNSMPQASHLRGSVPVLMSPTRPSLPRFGGKGSSCGRAQDGVMRFSLHSERQCRSHERSRSGFGKGQHQPCWHSRTSTGSSTPPPPKPSPRRFAPLMHAALAASHTPR